MTARVSSTCIQKNAMPEVIRLSDNEFEFWVGLMNIVPSNTLLWNAITVSYGSLSLFAERCIDPMIQTHSYPLNHRAAYLTMMF